MLLDTLHRLSLYDKENQITFIASEARLYRVVGPHLQVAIPPPLPSITL